MRHVRWFCSFLSNAIYTRESWVVVQYELCVVSNDAMSIRTIDGYSSHVPYTYDIRVINIPDTRAKDYQSLSRRCLVLSPSRCAFASCARMYSLVQLMILLGLISEFCNNHDDLWPADFNWTVHILPKTRRTVCIQTETLHSRNLLCHHYRYLLGWL